MGKRYGHFSAQSKAAYGSSLYATPSGESVEVTNVGDDPEARGYMWADKVFVGEVTTHVRRLGDGEFGRETREAWQYSPTTGQATFHEFFPKPLYRER